MELGGERAEEVRGEGGGHTEAQGAAGEVRDVEDGAFGGGEVLEGAAGVGEVGRSGVGEPYGAARAVEQLDPDGPLQLFDLLGQGGLGDAQLFGGAGEAAVFGDGEQIADMTQFRGHAVNYR